MPAATAHVEDMTAKALTHLPASATAADIHDVLVRDGAVVVDDLGDPACINRMRSETAPYIEMTAFGSDDFAGRRTRRTGALIARSPASRELIQHPLVLDVTGRLLDRATNFQLHLTQTIAIGPGEPAQPIHRDQWAFDFFPFPSDHDVQCNTIWAMTDFTEENGATRVIPGQQHAAGLASITPSTRRCRPRCRRARASSTPARSSTAAARTDRRVRDRRQHHLRVGWLRQEENQYLSVPREVAARSTTTCSA